MESLPRLTKWRDVPADARGPGGQTAVNVEWGAFSSEDLPRCQEDLDMDAASANPGEGFVPAAAFPQARAALIARHVAG